MTTAEARETLGSSATLVVPLVRRRREILRATDGRGARKTSVSPGQPALSSTIVTGPSLTSSTAMSAPKRPVVTGTAYDRMASAYPPSTSGSATGPGRRRSTRGGAPCGCPHERELAHGGPVPQFLDRALSAHDPGARSCARPERPRPVRPRVSRPRTRSPSPLNAAMTSPPTRTDAPSARWTTAHVDRRREPRRPLPMTEDRRVAQDVVCRALHSQRRHHGRGDHQPCPLAAVGDRCDAAAVGEAHGIDRLGAVLGPGAAHERGDAPGPADILRMGPHRVGDPGLRHSGCGGSEPAEGAGEPVNVTAMTGAPQPSTAVAATGSPARSSTVAMAICRGCAGSR